MSRTLAFLLLALPAWFSPSAQAAKTYELGRESGREIMERWSEKQEIDTELAEMDLTTISRMGEVERRGILSAIRRNEAGLLEYWMRFTSPEDIAGTTFLAQALPNGDFNQYLFLPALGQVTPITGDSKQASFMGSDFTYEDLQRESTRDYEYAYVGDGRIGSDMVYKVVAIANSPGRKRITGYARRILHLERESLNLLRVEFFDANNVHQKTLEAFGYESGEVAGPAIRPHRVIMENHQQGTTSVLTLKTSRLNTGLPEDIFELESLGRAPASQLEHLLEPAAE